MRVVLPILLLAVVSFIITPSVATELQTISIHQLESRPVLDGLENDWQTIPSVEIPLVYLGKPELVKIVRLKAGVFGDEVFFYSTWEDSSADIQHKPHIWDAAQQKYLEGPQREDRFALEFAMTEDYDANWFSGKEFKADMWNWKAARTNPIQISHDKMTIISRQAMPESYKGTLPDGSTIYIQRPTDSGEEPYITKRYFKKQQDLMIKYIPRASLAKGTGDVKAKGIWKDGRWYLEQSRKLDTQQADDVRFNLGETIKGAIAVFDHDDNEHHFISQTLLFKF
ncbi:MAG: hypothetical protein RLZZ215_957 [Pseudomonadota bacterium]|jgi:hypothetical protein